MGGPAGPRRDRRRTLFAGNIHPIWRGIGCILAILVPVIAFGLAGFLLTQMDSGELTVEAPPVELPVLGEVEDFWLIAGLGVLLVPTLFMGLAMLGSILYTLMGGPRNERMARRQREEEEKTYRRGGRR